MIKTYFSLSSYMVLSSLLDSSNSSKSSVFFSENSMSPSSSWVAISLISLAPSSPHPASCCTPFLSWYMSHSMVTPPNTEVTVPDRTCPLVLASSFTISLFTFSPNMEPIVSRPPTIVWPGVAPLTTSSSPFVPEARPEMKCDMHLLFRCFNITSHSKD